MDLYVRRRELLKMGDGVDWKAMFMGLVDGTLTGDVAIPDGVTTVFSYRFYNARITSVTLPPSCTIIKVSGFGNATLLERISLPDTFTRVEQNALSNCWALQNITFPAALSNIGARVLQGCTSLQWVKMLPVTPPTWSTLFFGDTTLTFPIYVPDESLEAYKTAIGWSTYADRYKPLSEFVES